MDDSQLVKFAKEGRLEAFKSLTAKYKDKIYNIAFSFTANAHDSADIAQNVFLKVFFNLNSFEEKSAFSTWLYRIAVNECCDALKKRRPQTLSLDQEIKNAQGLFLADILEDKSPGAEKILLDAETQNFVRRCLGKLAEKYKTVLILIDIEDLSYEEAAQVLKINVNALKVRLFRARAKLKDIIGHL